jgi:hypothetical protein
MSKFGVAVATDATCTVKPIDNDFLVDLVAFCPSPVPARVLIQYCSL